MVWYCKFGYYRNLDCLLVLSFYLLSDYVHTYAPYYSFSMDAATLMYKMLSLACVEEAMLYLAILRFNQNKYPTFY